MSRSKAPGVSGDPVDTFLDRSTLQTRIEARRTLKNDGETTKSFTVDKKGKFFARGMVGQIETVQIYTQNPTNAARAIDIRFRAYHDRSDEFKHMCFVPAGTAPGWVGFNIRKSWNYDRLYVYAETIDAATGIGFDSQGVPDTWTWDAVNEQWYEETSRLFIRVVMGAQVQEAVPVGIQTPITVEVDKGKYLSIVPSVGFFNGDFEMGDLTGWTSQGCTIVTRTVTTDTRNLSNPTEDGYINLTWAS
jgi:hypothetical protein